MEMNEGENYLLPVIPFAEAVMESGKGSWLYDRQGKKYLDLNSGQFCTVLGHSNEEILRQVWEKVSELAHTASDIVSDEVYRCAENLHRISGGMEAYSILLSTGSEAVEFCLRYAKKIQGKAGIICFDKGYHGLTLGSQSVTYSGKYAYPPVSDVATIPVPEDITERPMFGIWNDEESGSNDPETVLEYLDGLMKSGKYAAVLLEPIVSVGGMLFPPKEWFKKVRMLCNQYHVILILDESQTGFGRTGEWFAYQTYGFVPDMVIAAKGIGLGFPVSAVLFHKDLASKMVKARMTHYSSHQNDSFAAAVVNVGVHYIESRDICSRVRQMGNLFLEKLCLLEQNNPYIIRARGKGLMLGAELYMEGVEDYRLIYRRLHQRMLENGVIIQGTNGGRTLRFLPDYLISCEDIDFALKALDRVIREIGEIR